MILETFKHAIMITVFVIVMMLVIEFVNVQSKGNWNSSIKRSSGLQILIAALLGITPGSLGTFAAVSLYVHNILNFAALVTVMIATAGDEIFVMFAMIPETALILIGVIFFIAIISGFLINLITKKNYMSEHHKETDILQNKEVGCSCFQRKSIIPQLKNLSFQRALLISGVVFFLIFLISGDIGPKNWGWERITFLIISIIGGFIITTTSEHFLTEHIWKHVIKKHFLKIFLWTFGAFILINLLDKHINVNDWIKNNQIIILFIAVLIGIIPESGPNIVFISLFASGSIPFSILLANSIVQDGHGSLPLLAESQKNFLMVKFVNIIVGLIVGYGLMAIGV